jgi:acetyltransferase-like isoleucine patch superfamily enzyme
VATRDEAPGSDPGAARHSIRPVSVGTPQATAAYDAFLQRIERALAAPRTDRFALCRDVLWELYEGRPYDAAVLADPSLASGVRARLENLDPRNATLEPEYYYDCDPDRYAERKPLLWLWTMFDRSPLGRNLHLGFRLRRLLAPYVFKRVGRNLKVFQGLEVTFGYNLEVGDDVIIHREVLLDDRGGIQIGDRVSISDYANVYSHEHSIDDIHDITTPATVIEDGARITYHATVLAGTHVGVDGMVGAFGLTTKDVPPHTVVGGIPAKPILLKKRGKPAS